MGGLITRMTVLLATMTAKLAAPLAILAGLTALDSRPAGGSLTMEMDSEGRLPGDDGYDKNTRGKVTPEKLEELGIS